MANKLNFELVWNKLIERPDSRPLVKRDYMYASEIGGSYIDRYLSMAAIKPSNPPNFRSQRKFKSGEFWEFLVWLTLECCGIVIEYQGGDSKDRDRKSLRWQLPGMLEVSGRLDVLVGGMADPIKGKKIIEQMFLPDFFKQITYEIADYIAREIGEIRTTIVEVKSCSSQMFDRYEATRKPAANHVGQIKHYMMAKDLPGCIIYICRDDCRLMHFHLETEDPLPLEIYTNDVQHYSNYFYSHEYPPIEAPILYDKDTEKFTLNWRIEYSKYLTMVYGYDEPINFREDWEPKRDRWNRVLNKVKRGEKITADNLLAMREMEQYTEEFINTKRYFKTVVI